MEPIESEFVIVKEEPAESFLEAVEDPLDELNVSTPLFEASYVETDNKTLKYKCPMCNKKYKTKEKVQWHVNSHITFHSVSTNGDYKCLECSCYCENAESFQAHIKTHKRSRGRPKKGSVINCESIKLFVCDQCGKRFKRKQELFNHGFVHGQLKLYECSQCTKSFKLKQQLQNHLKVHIDIRPFMCVNCDKSFKFKQQLENHVKSHSDLRPFSCNFCEKGFKFKQQLQIHLKTHDDFRPYSCEFCDKQFKLKQQLQVHNKVHSDEKPFQCFTCGKSFKFKQQLQKHFRVHEKELVESSTESMEDLSVHSELNLDDDNREVDVEDLIPEIEIFSEKGTSFSKLINLSKDEGMVRNNVTFQCLECKESFLSEQELQVHGKIHEKEFDLEVAKSVRENLLLQSEINTEDTHDVNIDDLIPEVELTHDGSIEDSSGKTSEIIDQIDSPVLEKGKIDRIREVELRNNSSIRNSSCTISETIDPIDIPVFEKGETDSISDVKLRNDSSIEAASCKTSKTVNQIDIPIFESGELSDKNLCGEVTALKNGECAERT